MIQRIASEIANKPAKNGEFYLVAVDGRGGSGKTEFAKSLVKKLPGFFLMHGDSYFEPTPDGLAWGDFNEPRFKTDVIEPLSAGNTFTYKPYDWDADPHISEQSVNIDRGIIIDRCSSMDFPLDWDATIWIETPPAGCLERGLGREAMSGDEVTRVWLDIWQPREDAYIARVDPKNIATYVVDGLTPLEE